MILSLPCCGMYRSLLVCGRFRWQSILDHTETTNQIIVVNMLQNQSHRYSSHYKIIKCVRFEQIHYAINMDVVSSLKFLANLIICFYRMCC